MGIRNKILCTMVVLQFGTVFGFCYAQELPFGNKSDVKFAGEIWEEMQERGLVGENAVRPVPYYGILPHGVVLETFDSALEVDDMHSVVIVKRNFFGDGISPDVVANDINNETLVDITVMFKKRDFNPMTQDWFWVKYLPDGELAKTPQGIPMAGNITGCINCHAAAAGGDFVYEHDRLVGFEYPDKHDRDDDDDDGDETNRRKRHDD